MELVQPPELIGVRRRPARTARVTGLALAALLAAVLTVAAVPAATLARPAAASPAGHDSAARERAASATRDPTAQGLAARERAAQAVLGAQRARLLKRFAAHPERLFAAPFERVKPRLESSAVFRTLERMPKGGLLHIHSTGTGDAEWIVDRALSDPGCYIYWGADSGGLYHGQLAFFPDGRIPAGFVRVADLARTEPHLDRQLVDLFTIGAEDDATDAWQEFDAAFARIRAFVSYVPVFRGYYRDAFLDMARDGIGFVELRTGLGALTAEDGSLVTDMAVVQEYRSILASVRRAHPGFDLRIIVTTWRGATLDEAAAALARERALAAAAPDLIAGFDIIAQEDTGHSNGFYAPVLTTEPLVPLYLHAGESASPDDHNIQEALDLDARRIGHGLNMGLFPGLEDEVRAAGVTVEACPISNQALRYVPDLREHPAAGWIRRGLEVVLGSDDPELFQSRELSDDVALAYLAWGLDLGDLEELAVTSIEASSLPREAKQRQLRAFRGDWRRWVASVAPR